MQEVLKLVIGVVFLLLAWPIGYFLAKMTKEELKQGKKWFKLIILLSLVGALVSLFYRDDAFLFSFLFMALVTGMSLKKN